MGLMDKAIADTVKDTKDFKKTNIEKEARLATARQVGGSHYKSCKIQPVDYIVENNLVKKYATKIINIPNIIPVIKHVNKSNSIL